MAHTLVDFHVCKVLPFVHGNHPLVARSSAAKIGKDRCQRRKGGPDGAQGTWCEAEKEFASRGPENKIKGAQVES